MLKMFSFLAPFQHFLKTGKIHLFTKIIMEKLTFERCKQLHYFTDVYKRQI